MSRTEFRVFGLDCAEEVALLRRAVGPLVGGAERLGFDLVAGRIWVEGELPAGLERRLLAAIESAGLRAEPWRTDGGAEGAARIRRLHTRLTVASGLAAAGGLLLAALDGGVAAALGLGGGAAPPPLAARLAYLVAIALGGALFAPRALAAARRLRPDMNLLMTLAILGALALGDWLEAATVAFLFALSLALESWSVGRARRAIATLLDLSPPRAHRLEADGSTRLVDAAALAPGDRFLVRPGERVPLDGVLVEGESEVDEAPITGESAPVEKAPGAELWAGTVNGHGALVARATRPAGDTLLARILRVIAEAQERRAPAERFIDRFARIYTPAVLGAAALVALLPPLVAGADWSTWIYRGLVLLVIGCPCALVISTPVAVVAGLAAAARRGVLLKGGAVLEAAARIAAIAFDKTGTLTRGRPRLIEVVPLDGNGERELLRLAAALEARSEHPIAHAVVDAARERGLELPPVEGLRARPGRGAEGRVGGRELWLGSHRQLVAAGADSPAVSARLAALAAAGRSVVAIGEGARALGLLALADEPRPEAAPALARLRALGVGAIAMITGDNRATAEAIGERLGITEIEAELLPEEKLAAVERLIGRHGGVAMVGDGVNDAPALARATLGVAMGAAGSGAAIETADAALMADDLDRLPWLLAHARRSLAVIRANVAFALGVKALFFALALAGVATMWGAIAADMGASLLVIANSLRLLRG